MNCLTEGVECRQTERTVRYSTTNLVVIEDLTV